MYFFLIIFFWLSIRTCRVGKLKNNPADYFDVVQV